MRDGEYNKAFSFSGLLHVHSYSPCIYLIPVVFTAGASESKQHFFLHFDYNQSTHHIQNLHVYVCVIYFYMYFRYLSTFIASKLLLVLILLAVKDCEAQVLLI